MATATHITLEQFLALPETEPASEYICGEVIQKPMPDNAHALIQWFLVEMLAPFLRRTRLGRGGAEWRCVFGPRGQRQGFVPDLIFVSQSRMPKGNALKHRYLRSAPDLAVEILSRGQPDERFEKKITFYLAHGVRLVWIIDPRTRVVTVLTPGQAPRNLVAGDTLDGGDVLSGFGIAIAEIFAQLEVQ
jgi:Uma2 family endonuclease